PSGSAEPHLHTKRLLELVSKVIVSMPQQISISGHTDAKKFVSDTGYSNWELSADRANAARRELTHFKVPYEKVSLVVGKAATEPLVPEDPQNARNRRLSIVLLRGPGDNNPANPKNLEKKEKKPQPQPVQEKAQAPQAPKAPKTGAPLPPRVRATEGEALPGLEAIRRKQLEEGKSPAPAQPAPPKQ
ncbi:MAG: OmpA family protein, partial [Rhodospirillales bacterium]|nr:OmpA family protein [Rhodospirillales bacterium]